MLSENDYLLLKFVIYQNFGRFCEAIISACLLRLIKVCNSTSIFTHIVYV